MMYLAYEAFPEILLLKEQHAKGCRRFQAEEEALSSIRVELIDQVPFRSEKNFNWLKAADYYYCRKKHTIECIGTTQRHQDVVLGHLCFRFQQVCMY